MILTTTVSLYIWSLSGPRSLQFIAFCAFLWGISLDLWGSIWTTALQRLVPRDSLSRVSAFDAMGSTLFRPVGLALAAPLAGVLGIGPTLKYAAALSFIIAIGTLFFPEVRNMQFDSRTPGDATN
jgi:Transmembrane secretion effector